MGTNTTGKSQQRNTSNIAMFAALPTTPEGYYGVASNDVSGSVWEGGEHVFNSSDNRYYVQVNTSGRTASWKRLLDQAATTTSTSTSTSTTTTSTSTSSSTSTSTSTSSTTTP